MREGDYDTKVNETVNVVISFYGDNDEKLYYKLRSHRRHREIVNGTYLNHVMEEGKAIGVKSWQRKIFTNNRGEQWRGSKGISSSVHWGLGKLGLRWLPLFWQR